MRLLRTVIAAAMIVVGAVIFARMLHYPVRFAFTGLVLGAAMVALGVIRLRAIYAPPLRR